MVTIIQTIRPNSISLVPFLSIFLKSEFNLIADNAITIINFLSLFIYSIAIPLNNPIVFN
jgi:hypothetical protein